VALPGSRHLEIQEQSVAKRPTLTTDSGMPVSDNQNSITAGPRGPLLMQDFYLLEKLAHQNRERIPERTVHAKGSAAYGTLTITNDISKYTKAKALQRARRPKLSCVARRWRASAAPPTPSATCAASRCASTRRKATGTSSATTRRCSSCAMP